MGIMDLSIKQETMGVKNRFDNQVFKLNNFDETDVKGNNNLYNSRKTDTDNESGSLFRAGYSSENLQVDPSLFSYSSFKKAMDLRMHNRSDVENKRTIFDDADYFAKNFFYKLLPITFEQVDETIIHTEHNYSLFSLNSESEAEEDCSRTMDYSQIKEKNYKRRRTKFKEGSDEEVIDGNEESIDSNQNKTYQKEPSPSEMESGPDNAILPLDLSTAPPVQEQKTDHSHHCHLKEHASGIEENLSPKLKCIQVTITRPNEKENYQPCDMFLNDIARLVPRLINNDCFEIDILDRTDNRHEDLRKHRLYYIIAESTWRLFQSTRERVILTNDHTLGPPVKKIEKDERPTFLVFDQFSLAKCLAEYCEEIGGCFEYTCIQEEKEENVKSTKMIELVTKAIEIDKRNEKVIEKNEETQKFEKNAGKTQISEVDKISEVAEGITFNIKARENDDKNVSLDEVVDAVQINLEEEKSEKISPKTKHEKYNEKEGDNDNEEEEDEKEGDNGDEQKEDEKGGNNDDEQKEDERKGGSGDEEKEGDNGDEQEKHEKEYGSGEEEKEGDKGDEQKEDKKAAEGHAEEAKKIDSEGDDFVTNEVEDNDGKISTEDSSLNVHPKKRKIKIKGKRRRKKTEINALESKMSLAENIKLKKIVTEELETSETGKAEMPMSNKEVKITALDAENSNLNNTDTKETKEIKMISKIEGKSLETENTTVIEMSFESEKTTEENSKEKSDELNVEKTKIFVREAKAEGVAGNMRKIQHPKNKKRRKIIEKSKNAVETFVENINARDNRMLEKKIDEDLKEKMTEVRINKADPEEVKKIKKVGKSEKETIVNKRDLEKPKERSKSVEKVKKAEKVEIKNKRKLPEEKEVENPLSKKINKKVKSKADSFGAAPQVKTRSKSTSESETSQKPNKDIKKPKSSGIELQMEVGRSKRFSERQTRLRKGTEEKKQNETNVRGRKRKLEEEQKKERVMEERCLRSREKKGKTENVCESRKRKKR